MNESLKLCWFIDEVKKNHNIFNTNKNININFCSSKLTQHADTLELFLMCIENLNLLICHLP